MFLRLSFCGFRRSRPLSYRVRLGTVALRLQGKATKLHGLHRKIPTAILVEAMAYPPSVDALLRRSNLIQHSFARCVGAYVALPRRTGFDGRSLVYTADAFHVVPDDSAFAF